MNKIDKESRVGFVIFGCIVIDCLWDRTNRCCLSCFVSCCYLVFTTDRRIRYYLVDFIDLILSSNHSCVPSWWWGAYVVSSENLGKNAGLIAGGSLLIDYMLTVAVFGIGWGRSDYFCRTRSIWASGGYLDHYCFTDHDDELTGATRICEFLDGSCIHLYRCDHDLDSCRII